MNKIINLIGVGGARRYLAKDGTYNEAWTAVEANGVTQGFGQYFSSNDYVIYRATNKIDTRAIPIWATIVSATVTFTLSYDGSVTDFDFVIQNLAPVSESPDNTWFNKEYFSGDGGSVNSLGISGLITISFNEAGLALIQKEDYTKLGIRSSRDIAGIAPPGLEYITYSGYIYYNITYIAVPSVSSISVYSITENTATCSGKLLKAHDDAGCDKIGVCYNKTGMPTVDDNKVEEDGSFWDNKTIVKVLMGLSPGTTYYCRVYSHNPTGYGYGDEIEFKTTGFPIVVLNNIGAENNSVFARTILTGEIVNEDEAVIVERGFEYKIQEEEPGSEDTGTEVKETKAIGFVDGEYSLRNKELYDQQYIDDNIVWWFRAYCKDGSDNKHPAQTWMKNLPTVTTQDMTSINYNKADGNGTVVSKGASELTRRGFEIKHEYSGSYMDSWKFEIAGFEGELESETTEGAGGVIIDFYWAGDLVKTVLETVGLALGAYSITIGQMEFGWPVSDDCLIEGKAYKCRAFASNEFGTVYGDEVDFSTWARSYLSEDLPTIGEITIIKNEVIENLPVGVTASRRGFRYGTTEAADEFDVHENGSFTNGPYSMMLTDLLPDTTYYIVGYIVVNGITHEGDMETITTDPEGTEDEDEYPTPHFSPHGQDYREMETKVFAEVLASIGIIEFSGGKKTLPIVNHLIQTNSDAKTIADNYLNRFKLAKTRMTVTFPTPLPFEREDTVDFSYGALLFKNDDEGIAHFKEDGEGVSVLMDQITMIIKQINSVGLTKTQTSIEYVADLDLEHE